MSSEERGYYGISFPFRLGVKGGVVMSGTSALDSPHIEESIMQILNTTMGERVMEFNVGTNISMGLFEPNDESVNTLIKYEIVKALETYEPRIEVTQDDITLENVDDGHKSYVLVGINYRVIDFANTEHSISIKLGGNNNGEQ